MASNSAGAVIKLPRRVYSQKSEASVSNDGKIQGFCFCKFPFLSSVIKFDKKCANYNRRTIEVDHCLCKVKNLLSKTRLFITTLLFISVTLFAYFGAHFVETQARFQQTCLFSGV